MERIYLDHAATSPLLPQALEGMLPWLRAGAFNASSIHTPGRRAHEAVAASRRQVAQAIGCRAEEVYFTCGGTESDNWALKGLAWAARTRGRHIVTSAIEHHAVLHVCAWLENNGFEVTYVPPQADGVVNPDCVARALRADTVLVSLMAANNEVGTLQPLAAVSQITRPRGILLHTDAVQAMGATRIDVNAWGCDALSLSAHKFGGPQGIGALFFRRGTPIEPLLHGGAQESRRRAGTENVAGIAGMGIAAQIACADIEENARAISALRDHLQQRLLERIPGASVNGSGARLPGNLNMRFDGIAGQALLPRLDLAGISASAGSACAAGATEPSHVLVAMGLTAQQAHSSVRFSIGRENTLEQMDETARRVEQIVFSLRSTFLRHSTSEGAACPN